LTAAFALVTATVPMLTSVCESIGSGSVSLARTSNEAVPFSPVLAVSGLAVGGVLAPFSATDAVAVPVLNAVVPPVAPVPVRSVVLPRSPVDSSQAW
jgi:hypothetical protein